MRKWILLLPILLPVLSFGQVSEVRRITEQLCSPAFHGRGYVQHGDSMAAAFLADEFRKLGVQPYKNHSYFQDFSIEGINRFPGKMELSCGGRPLTPGIHFLVAPESGGGRMTLHPVVLKGTELLKTNGEKGINEGYLQSQLKRLGTDGRNSIVVDLGGLQSDSARQLAGLSEALAENYPVVEIMDGKFTWSVGRSQLAHPLLFMQDSVYREGQDFEMEIEAEFLSAYSTRNVVAWLPCKKKCAETLVFSAHYDHLGRMGEDTYFPGANDNASGTAMLLSMAKYFKEHPAPFNIMYIAFAGEEAGLVGSHYFTEHPIIPLKKIDFLVNLDIMGSGEEGITVVNATLFEKQFNLLEEINTEKNLLAKIKKRGEAANSDHYWFTKSGVPAFFIYTMGPNKHYHDVFDTYSELSFSEYDDIVTLLTEFVRRLSLN